MAMSDRLRIWAGDIVSALMLLTRLPLRWSGPLRQAQAAWAWPLAGLCVSAIAVAVGLGASLFGLPVSVTAGLMLASSVIATGGLHEDGLADVADGFWGGTDRARRLDIMRDSRIGSYGVLALILSLGLRWAALSVLVAAGAWGAVVAAGVLSRAPMAAIMALLPNARQDGLSRHVGRPSRGTVLVGTGLALGVAFAGTGWLALVAAAAAGLVAMLCAGIAKAKIGGQTGDVLGSVQQMSEIAALLAFTALLA